MALNTKLLSGLSHDFYQKKFDLFKQMISFD